jgi:hypothetical protein
MSITYQAYVEAVGPAQAVAAFRQHVQEAGLDRQTLELCVDRPCHVAFNAITSGAALDLAHQRPQLGEFAHQQHGQFPHLVIRVQQVTECVHVTESVYAGGQALFCQVSEDDFDNPLIPPQVLVHHREGNPDAWGRACALYGVMASA